MRDKIWKRLEDGSWDEPRDRRTVLKGAGGMALGATALGAIGCGVGGGDSSSSDKDTEKAIKPKVDGDLVYFNWAEYLDPALIKGFEKEYGVKVRESNFDSMQGMMAKLRAGNSYDVIFPTAEWANRLIRNNQLIKIPREDLKNADQLLPFFDDPWYDKDSAHTVPYSMYTTGICWRNDKIKNMTKSWNDLANEEGKGKIFVLDDFQEGLGAANYRNGSELNTTDQGEIDKSTEWLISFKPLLRGYSTDDIQNLVRGDAWIHHAWNGDVVNVRNQAKNPENFSYETCKEGIPVGSDTFAIPTNAKHPGTALLFIDWMMDPDNAAKNVKYFGYPMPNKGAEQAFAELVKDDPSINVTTDDLTKGDQFKDLGPDGRKMWDTAWTKVKAS